MEGIRPQDEFRTRGEGSEMDACGADVSALRLVRDASSQLLQAEIQRVVHCLAPPPAEVGRLPTILAELLAGNVEDLA